MPESMLRHHLRLGLLQVRKGKLTAARANGDARHCKKICRRRANFRFLADAHHNGCSEPYLHLQWTAALYVFLPAAFSIRADSSVLPKKQARQ